MPSDPIALAQVKVSAVDGTSWHLQFNQAGIKLTKGQFYTLSFRARTDGPKQIAASIGQAHEPWQNLGLATPVKLYAQDTDQYYGFVATADDDNGFQLDPRASLRHQPSVRLICAPPIAARGTVIRSNVHE